MDKLSKKILSVLKEDARFTHKKIAELLGVEEKEISVRIAEMEEKGIIVKYSAIVNADKTGEEGVIALIEVKVTPQQSHGFDAIAKEIYKFDEVTDVYLMSGGYDIAVTVEGKNLREVAMFVSERLSVMENVISTATHFILKKYKSEGVILDEEEDIKRIPVQA